MKYLDTIERLLCIGILAAIVLLVFSAAVMRTIGLPIIWSVDVAQLLFAWLCMLGANQTLKHSQHACVDLFTQYLTDNWQRRLNVLVTVLMLVVLGLITAYGMALFTLNPQRTLGSTAIPYRLVTLALPVGAFLMLLTLLEQCWLSWRVTNRRQSL